MADSGGVRLGLHQLADATGQETGPLGQRLWELAWQGRLSNTTFLAVRQGTLNRFTSPESVAPATGGGPRRSGRRRSFERWQSSRPTPWPGLAATAVLPPG